MRTMKVRIRPHYGQRAVLESTAFCTAAIAGTGGGKTVGGYPWLLKEMVGNPGQTWVVAEPTGDMLERILFTTTPQRPSLIEFLGMFDPQQVWLRSKRVLRHQYGTVFFASADRPDSMQGAHVAGFWLDEAGMMKYAAFLVAVQRVGFTGGKLLLTTTPYNMGWLKKKVADRGRSGDKDYNIINFPSTANPAYPRESVDRARETMSKVRFEMMYEGKFGRPEGMIYESFDSEESVEDDPVKFEGWVFLGGLDLGWNHPTAGVLLGRDPQGRTHWLGEYRQTATSLKRHRDALGGMFGGIGDRVVWYADRTAPQQIAELRRYGLNVRPVPTGTPQGAGSGRAVNEVAAGIDLVYEQFASRQLMVARSIEAGVEELEGYVWVGGEEGFKDEPVKEDDDLMDALRYAVWAMAHRQALSLST